MFPTPITAMRAAITAAMTPPIAYYTAASWKSAHHLFKHLIAATKALRCTPVLSGVDAITSLPLLFVHFFINYIISEMLCIQSLSCSLTMSDASCDLDFS